ncbi:MAG: hypothetical protein JJ969_02960 [Rhizobiaceae bacterium]|jgi:hypothetical protein|nr:hypothetical protein [Rhizobiaceae bacterium]MBO6726545.1 hypothetical protein [Rhizobiaceae bacterium]
MFKKIRTAALSALIGLGALSAAPATAQADSFYFGITPHGPTFGFYGDSSRRHWHHNRHYKRDQRRYHRRDCNPRRALRKADRMGINRARVRSENRHVIRVAGRKYRQRVVVTFAKAPRCPVVGWR